MEEKRRDRRLDLDVAIKMNRIDMGVETGVKIAHVTVTDLSGSGMGFQSAYPMEIDALYHTDITLWTKETLKTVIRIVYCKPTGENGYQCGARFVGLSSADAMKINIYEMLNPEEEAK